LDLFILFQKDIVELFPLIANIIEPHLISLLVDHDLFLLLLFIAFQLLLQLLQLLLFLVDFGGSLL